MQIREKGQKVLCIRTAYVPEKKRTVGVTVASQRKGMSTVSDEVRQRLEKEEVEQLEKWLSKRSEKTKADRLRFSLLVVNQYMKDAAEALNVDGLDHGLSQEQAADIWTAHETLSKALRRNGFKKPAKEKQAKKQSVDNQNGLPFDA